MEKITREKRAKETDLLLSNITAIKTLGMLWLVEDDEFSFQVETVLQPPITRRTLLTRPLKLFYRPLKLFYPLWFLSPFVVQARILLQELWVKGMEWDAPVEIGLYRQEKIWLEDLKNLASLRIHRCIEMNHDKSTSINTLWMLERLPMEG